MLLERAERIGGLWRDLPSWQDIQFRKEDWTLGDIPISGEDQPSILRNIEAWVERFDLASHIRLNACVERAGRGPNGWRISTGGDEYEATWLIAATGAYNRALVPEVERKDSAVLEYHSSLLRDPGQLTGKRVVIVGGGASAYDLLDLSLAHGASGMAWVYRSTKWMRPTRRSKYLGTDMRLLAKYQMLGMTLAKINRRTNEDLQARYAKAGIDAIRPAREFDFRRDQ